MNKLIKLLTSAVLIGSSSTALTDAFKKDDQKNTIVFNNQGNEFQNVRTKRQSRPSALKYLKWHDVNPFRLTWDDQPRHVTEKVQANNFTYFSPYVDAGLSKGITLESMFVGTKGIIPGPDKKPFNNQVKNLKHVTISFVQQSDLQSDKLELTIAGVSESHKGFALWESNFKTNITNPLQKRKLFKNITLSFGGEKAASVNKNIWEIAYKQANRDVKKAANLLADEITKYTAKISKKYGKNVAIKKLDFDIEGNAMKQTKELETLAETLSILKERDSSLELSVTLPVAPLGLDTNGLPVLEIFVKNHLAHNLDPLSLPTINLMAMNYGDWYYDRAVDNRQTGFDLAREAVEQTKEQISDLFSKHNHSHEYSDEELYKLLAITPMIGINDHRPTIFTLEDAKDLYNWAHEEGLKWFSMWALSDDSGLDDNGDQADKSYSTHGLNYLRKWDFTRAFTGEWTDWIKTPDVNPFKV